MKQRDYQAQNRLNKSDEKVWKFLVEYANIFNPVEISYMDICISTKMNLFTILKCIKKLERMKAIEVARGKCTTNKYTVDLNLQIKEKIDKYSYKAVLIRNSKYKVFERIV